MSRKAFTLIELLVVISIVALLASVVLASLNSARDKGRLAAGKQFEANMYHAEADQAVGVWDLDECSGTGVSDRSANGNNGALTGGVSFFPTDTPNGLGCSLSFDGSSGYVNVPDSASMDFSGDISVSAWVKPASIAGGATRVILAKRGAVLASYELFIHNPSGGLGFYNGVSNTVSTYVPPLNQWVHVAAVVNGTTLKLYANGQEVLSSAFSATVANVGIPFVIGAYPSGSQYFSGLIDSVRVFNKSLTATEVGRLYAAGLTSHHLTDNVK